MLKKTPVFLLLFLVFCFLLTGCGKRGDPLPPIKHLPYNLFKMQVSQQGEKAVLILTVPRTTQEGKPFEKEDFGKLEIYCLAEKNTGDEERKYEEYNIVEEEDKSKEAPPGGMVGGAGGMKIISGMGGMPGGDLAGWQSIDDQTESSTTGNFSFRETGMSDIFPRDVFERKSDRIFVVEKDDMDKYATGWRFTVPIELASLSEDNIYEKRLYFAVKLFNSKGQNDGLSSLVALTPEVVPNPPTLLKAETSQEAIKLTWQKPETMTDGTELKENIGYLIFRALGDDDFNPLPLNTKPLDTTEFMDSSFRFNKTYRYRVRAAIVKEKSLKESDNSVEVAVQTIDLFPPAVPAGLNSVKGESEITLIWSPNLENDLDGYNVYRSADPDKGFLKLNDLPLKKNAFINEDVEINKTYYYKVTAVDNASPPNESGFSETVAEKLP